MLKKVFSFIAILFFSFGLYAQDLSGADEITIQKVLADYPVLLQEYESLLNEYEGTLDDYESLITEYDALLTNYTTLLTEYSDLKIDYESLNTKYAGEIIYHENSITALGVANETIDLLKGSVEDLLSITDTRYLAIYPQVGYMAANMSFGLGFTVRMPKVPLSLMIDADYVTGIDTPLNIQIGLGIRF